MGNDITRPVCSVTYKRSPAWARFVSRLKDRFSKILCRLGFDAGTGVGDSRVGSIFSAIAVVGVGLSADVGASVGWGAARVRVG